MGKALEYLNNTQMKISDIADYLGYESVDHFHQDLQEGTRHAANKIQKNES